MKNMVLMALAGLTLFAATVGCNLATETVKAATLDHQTQIAAVLGE